VWRQVALLRPDEIDDSSWTGYQCLSGDGRFAAVALMPLSASNTPSLREHGAFAYTVDLANGAVHAVASGVALEYFSPGCGTGDVAVFSVSPDDFASSTEVLSVDMASGAVSSEVTVKGQLTSAVPTSSGVMGVVGASLVKVSGPGGSGTASKVVTLPGLGYDLRPASDGGVDLLAAAPHGSAAAWHESGGKLSETATGSLTGLGLFQGERGRNILTGASKVMAAHGDRVVMARGLSGQVAFASLGGGKLFGFKGVNTAERPLAASTVTAAVQAMGPAAGAAPPKATVMLPGYVPPGVPDPVRRVPLPAPGSARSGREPGAVKSADLTAATTSAGPEQATSASTPVCSVARLSPSMQVMQPDAAQVDWATQMAEQGLLTGTKYQRPANYANMGLAAYSPSSDFAPVRLDHPSTSRSSTVPRSVMEAIMAQESNWDQASWHALPGISADPLIADYYGAAGTIDTINYSAADCGYGLAQVTDGMQIGEGTYSVHGQMKIANDYEENIAAGLQILESTWNQLYTAGIIANNGDPADLENWYFAAWAYNSGVEPNAAHGNTTGCVPGPSCKSSDGTWGLGWANNPADPAYPPNREPFLEDTYADAAHPGDWPYQERIMGWMGSPLLWDGVDDYAPATFHGGNAWLQLPGYQTFCTPAGDDCTPGVQGQGTLTPGQPGTCNLSDSYCWWHTPVTWAPSCATTCATSSYTVGAGSTDPGVVDPHPPTCTVSASDLPTTSHGAPIIVLDDTETSSGVPTNVVGCTTPVTSGGTFTMAYGTNANGDPVGAIDTHQLGAGFGGHILFSHTESGATADLINTGTWAPTLPSTQYYQVKVHLPATGAAATDIVYDVNPGGSLTPFKIRVNQGQEQEVWVTLGTFALAPGATVTMSNQSDMAPGMYDVAYDAVAFLPEGGTPGVPIGGPPTVADAPAGSNPAWLKCPCTYDGSADPVDTGTGAYSRTWTDLSVPGRGAPLDFTRTYTSATADPDGPNGALAVDGPFGYGWTYSYGLSAATDATTGDVTITQEDGSKVTFTDSSGVYTPSEVRDDASLVASGPDYIYTRKGSQVLTFAESTGELIAETDLAGYNASPAYQTTLAYDSSGQLSTVTDPDGRTFTLTWASGHITRLVDSAGRTVTYAYDSAGDLTDVYGVGTTRTPAPSDDDHTQYAYTAAHLMSSVRQPDFYGSKISPAPVTSMTYDSTDRVTSQTDEVGATTTFFYGPSTTPSLQAGQTLVTDPSGHETLDTYSEGLLVSETKGYGTSAAGTWSYAYDPISLGVVLETDPDGDVTTASYDNNGDMVESSNADGFTTSYTYNSEDQVTSMTGPLGVQTTYAYDQAGHVATASGTSTGAYTWGDLTSQTVTQQLQTAEIYNGLAQPAVAAPRTTNYYYDGAAHPADRTRTVDPMGTTTSTTYDAAGDLTSITGPAGDKTLYGYDTLTGWATSTVSPAGAATGTATTCLPPAMGCTTYEHDAWGDVTATTDPLGDVTKATYDADGNKTSSTDADGNVTSYTYDPAGELTQTTRADGTTLGTAYNPDGTVASTTDAAGDVTKYGYDAQGRQVSVTNPDSETTTTGYDPAGHVTSVTAPDGTTTTSAYDPAGQLTATTYSRGSTPDVTGITYDPTGDRVAMTDGTGTSTWSYDAFGELTQSVNGAGAVVSYLYDKDGHNTGIVYPNGQTVTHGYNDAGQLTSVTDGNGGTTTFAYTPDGLPAKTVYPNNTAVTYGYDNDDRQTLLSLTAGTTTIGAVADSWDNDGQLTASAPSGQLPGPVETYKYTDLQQVQSVTSGATAPASTTTTAPASTTTTAPASTTTTQPSATTTAQDGAATAVYGYDAANDPTALAGTTAAYDPASMLCWSTTATVTGTPSCTSPPAGATTYTYNADGQRTGTAPATSTASGYTYNQAGELTAATTPDGSGTYTYDGDGQRTSKTVNGTTTNFTWAVSPGDDPVVIYDGATSYVYGPGGLPVEQVSPTTTSYFVHDQHGNTIALTGATGTIVASYTYNAYGQATATTGTTTTPLRYGQGYADPETGLIYLVNRYYDPVTAQFLSVDPLEATTESPYGYAGDDPVNGGDPSGLWPGEGLWHDVLDVVAVPVYATYYGSYEAAKAINDVGCSLGGVGCAVSHILVATTSLPMLEASGLAGDAALDWLKNKTTGNGESVFDEDICGGILPRFIDNGGPKTWLPGLSKNQNGSIHVDFEW
jgi:RHS repeat-associated protein